jgi:methyl-accepting chemotaxis protein
MVDPELKALIEVTAAETRQHTDVVVAALEGALRDGLAAGRAHTEHAVGSMGEQLREELRDGLAAGRAHTDNAIGSLREHTDSALGSLREHTDNALGSLREDLRAEFRNGLAAGREHTDNVALSLRAHTDSVAASLREQIVTSNAETRHHFDILAESVEHRMGLMGDGFAATNAKIEDLSERVDGLSERVDHLSDTVHALSGAMKSGFKQVDRRLRALEDVS